MTPTWYEARAQERPPRATTTTRTERRALVAELARALELVRQLRCQMDEATKVHRTQVQTLTREIDRMAQEVSRAHVERDLSLAHAGKTVAALEAEVEGGRVKLARALELVAAARAEVAYLTTPYAPTPVNGRALEL